jgi:ribosomal protein S18 acetylase RimI-like enzyme
VTKIKHEISSLLFSVVEDDIEVLRINKNNNKDFFFLKEEISPEQQKNWFLQYLKRDEDFMFVCKEGGLVFGCMGFRIFEDKIDAYNIMRFSSSSITMEKCMEKMIEFSRKNFPGKEVQVRVIKGNPAVSWYKKIGFRQVSDETNFIIMYYNN